MKVQISTLSMLVIPRPTTVVMVIAVGENDAAAQGQESEQGESAVRFDGTFQKSSRGNKAKSSDRL